MTVVASDGSPEANIATIAWSTSVAGACITQIFDDSEGTLHGGEAPHTARCV
jgi:hypothetical protein